MSNCLWCHRKIQNALSFSFILSFKAASKPSICSSCLKLCSAVNPKQACPQCCRQQSNKTVCSDCIKWNESRQAIHYHRAIFNYQGLVKDWLKQYKYQGDYRLRFLFLDHIKEVIAEEGKGYTLVPIPISQNSMKKRGFNQITAILDAGQIPYKNLLENKASGLKQSKKNRKQRMESSQPFRRLEPAYQSVQDKKFLIFDDVYTTGRTLFHAYDCLKQTADSQIKTLTIAR